MTLSEKIVKHRKLNNWSQEDLAERLNVSRQSVSKWEVGSALPDASNILQLSKLFNVTSDYLLNDDYVADADVPQIKSVRAESVKVAMAYFVVIEVMILILQFMTSFILKSPFFFILSCVPFAVLVISFYYAFNKYNSQGIKEVKKFKTWFLRISAVLGCFFPVRFLVAIAISLLDIPMNGIIYECVALILYLMVEVILQLEIGKGK